MARIYKGWFGREADKETNLTQRSSSRKWPRKPITDRPIDLFRLVYFLSAFHRLFQNPFFLHLSSFLFRGICLLKTQPHEQSSRAAYEIVRVNKTRRKNCFLSSCLVIYTLFHTPPLPSSILFNFAPVVFTKGWKNPAATLQLRWINERFQIELFNCAYCFIHVTSFFAFRVYEYSFSYGNQNSDKLCSKTVRKGGPSHSDQKEKIVNETSTFRLKKKKKKNCEKKVNKILSSKYLVRKWREPLNSLSVLCR